MHRVSSNPGFKNRDLYKNLIRTKQNGVIIALDSVETQKHERSSTYAIAVERMSKGEVEQVHILCGQPGARSNFDHFLRNSIIILEDAHLVKELDVTIEMLRPRENLVVVSGTDVKGSELATMAIGLEDKFETTDEIDAHLFRFLHET